MELWQKLVMEHDLIDIESWLDHAERSRAFKDFENPREEAIKSKSESCARRLLSLSPRDPLPPDLDLRIIEKTKVSGYKNRKMQEEEREIKSKEKEKNRQQNLIALEKEKKEALRAEILEMKKEGLI